MENDKKETQPEKNKKKDPDFEVIEKMWVKAFIWVVVLMAVYLGIMYCMKYRGWGMEKRGQFGDMFAVVNTFFSGMAFMLLFYTVVLQMLQMKTQRQDMKSQKKDLEITKEELARQSQAQQDQARMQALSSFINANVYLHSFYTKEKENEFYTGATGFATDLENVQAAKEKCLLNIVNATKELNEKINQKQK